MAVLVTVAVLATLWTSFASGQVCPANWQGYSSTSKCYRFGSTNKMSWQDARDFCQIHGGDLLQLESVRERNWIWGHINGIQKHGKFNGTWWTGLNNREFVSSWEWADGSALTSGILNWKPGSPGNAGGNLRCAVILGQGQMDDQDCGQQNQFVCQRLRGVPMTCDADHGWQTLNYQCYKVYSSKLSWDDAKKKCDNDGASMVTIAGRDEEVVIRDFAVNQKTPMWIGIRSLQLLDGYIWTLSNSSQLQGLTYWNNVPVLDSSKRNSTCVMMDNNVADIFAWTPADCNTRQEFVCRKPEGVCFPGWIGHRTNCYQFDIHYKLSFPAATNYCKQQGAELAHVYSIREIRFLNTYLPEMRDSGVASYWIGASDENIDIGPFIWRGNPPHNVTYNYWAGRNNTPENVPGKRDCAFVSTSDSSGRWRTTSDCLSAKPFVCMIPMGRTVQQIARTPRPFFGCPPNWKLYNDKCYYVNATNADWLTARESCTQASFWADLVSITDSGIQAFVEDKLGLQKNSPYWIGLSDRAKQNYYSWLDDPNNITYSHWHAGQPNDNKGQEKCTMMDNGLWWDRDCKQKYHFICSKPADSINPSLPPSTPAMDWTLKCGTGWESNPLTDDCYKFVDEPLSWLDAVSTCQHFQGTLVSIENVQEQNYISARIQTMNSIALWTGANDRGKELFWRWVGGAPFAYLNWAAGQPDTSHGGGTDCVAMFTQNAQWDDIDCNERNSYICEKKGSVPTTQATTVATKKIPAGMVLGCAGSWRPFQDYCYLFTSPSISATDAKARCERSGGHLASINSKSEQDFIVANLPKGKADADAFIIGMDDHKLEMMFTWQDGSPVTYTNWNRDEPNNYHDKEEDCVEVRLKDGLWNDMECFRKRQGYICKRPKAAVSATVSPYQQGCPKYAQGYGAKCYRTITSSKKWVDANAYCMRAFNGTLATINDRYVQAFVSSSLVYRSGYFWIGMSDTASPGTYLWINNASVQFTDWHNTHTGNELSTCVAMRADQPKGLWENLACTSPHRFICQFDRVGFTVPPSTPTPNPSILCPAGWAGFGSKCYYAFSKMKLTWMESHAFCNNLGGDLASIHRQAEDNFFSVVLLKPYETQPFWIGLNDRSKEAGYVWTDSSPYDYSHWVKGEPNDYVGSEDCVDYNIRYGGWNDNNCYGSKAFVCSVNKGVTIPPTNPAPVQLHAPECGSDPNWYLYKDQCYWFSPSTGNNSSMTWYDAKDYCTAAGANLASIHSMDENQFVYSIISKRTWVGHWLGLNELRSSGYTWTDGTPTDFAIWRANEPNDWYGAERCVEMYSGNGFWNDAICDVLTGVVCKKPLHGQAPVVTPAPYTPGGCSNGFTRVPGGRNKCFLLGGMAESDRLNWTEARDACRKYGDSVDIASIEDSFEQEFAISMLNGSLSVWLGLTNRQNNKVYSYKNKFFWQDNAQLAYTNWDRFQPQYNTNEDTKTNARCVSMRVGLNHQGKWSDVDCNQKNSYLCSSMQDSTVSIVSPPNTCQTTGYQSYRNNCYKVSSDALSFAQANTSCQNGGAQLVSILDPFENAFVYTLAKGQYSYWIGLSDTKVPGLYGWQDGWPVVYSNWASGEPSYETNGGCVFADLNARWNDSDCSTAMHYVCKITTSQPPSTTASTGHCSSPGLIPLGNYCYYPNVNDGRSWAEANYECQTRGMELASIHTQWEMDFVFNLVAQAKVTDPNFKPNIWIGMTKGLNGAFKWSDNSVVDYLYWNQGEPSGVGWHDEKEECVEILRQGKKWNDQSCFSRRGYVCKTSKVTTTTPYPMQPMQTGQTGQTIKHQIIAAIANGQRCPAYWQGYTSSSKCYRFGVTNTMSWQDARDFCQIHGGDLVKLESVTERNWIVNRVKNIEAHDAIGGSWWVGLNNREYLKIWEWADGSPVTGGILNWNHGAPDNAGGNQRCALVLSTGLMDDTECDHQNQFICQRSRGVPLVCDSDRGWQTLNGQCYKVYGAKRSWDAAKARCDHDGGAMVTIDNVNDEIVMHDFAVNQKTPLWIGVRTLQTSSGYVWMLSNSSQLLGQTYWHTTPRIASASRNNTCVTVKNNVADINAWSTSDCTKQQAYVCRKPEGVCYPGWIGHQSYCYQFDVHYRLSFPAATDFCKNQGGELLRIQRSSQQAFINTYLPEMRDSGLWSFWIGASDNNQNNGPFVWRNGRNVTFNYWGGSRHAPHNTPYSQDCTYISTAASGGYWQTTYDCMEARPFVCMIPMGKAVSALPTTPRPFYGCSPGWSQYEDMCYRVNETTADWLTAREACQNKYFWADLVTIPERGVQGFLQRKLNLQPGVKYWIGLSDRRVQNIYSWLDYTQNITYSNWKAREPNDYHGNEKCVLMRSGLWIDAPCTQRNQFICGMPSDTINPSPPPTTPATDWTIKCGPGWESNPLTSSCYMFVDQPLSWLDAVATCRHVKGQIVAIETNQEQNYLTARIQSMQSIAVWIGANDRGHETLWQWVGRKPFAFFNWAAGQPDTQHGGGTDCVAMYTQNAKWDDVNCNNRNGYICEKTGKVPRTRPTRPPKVTVPAGMVLGCKTGWLPFQTNCYRFVSALITGNDAKLRCTQSGGKLASIHSQAEQNFIFSNLPATPKNGSNTNDAFFIGMDDHLLEMMFTWQDGSPVTYTRWSPHEPNSYQGREEDCVEMWRNTGLWNDQMCWAPGSGYVCKAPKTIVSATQNPYQQGCPMWARGYGASCYKTVTTKQSWSDANAYCASAYQGTLATVNDRFVEAFLSSFLSYRSGYYWIGMSDTVTPGTYSWVNNATVQFTYWHNTHTGNEMSTCVAMRADDPVGLWENLDCTATQGGICQFPRTGFTPAPMPPTLYPNIPCPYGWLELNQKCYYAFGKQKLNWMESRAFCNNLGGDLLSIHKQSEDNFVSGTLLKPFKNTAFWMALNDRDTEMGYVWADGSPLDYTHWGDGEPNDYQGNEDCVEYTTRINMWNDNNCYGSKHFICVVQKGVTLPPATVAPTPMQSVECGTDLNWYLYEDSCYYVSPDSGENSTLPWYDAVDYCTAAGSNLVSIHSLDENQFLFSVMSKKELYGYWTGLNELGLNGYKWTDGTPTDFVRWDRGEPNDYYGAERCIEIRRDNGNWNDLVCSVSLGFICKKPLHGKAPVIQPTVYPPGGCANGFTKVPGGRNKCFYIGGLDENGGLNWTQARDTCRAFGTGYDIVSIEDQFEQEFIIRMLGGRPGDLWTGLSNRPNYHSYSDRNKFYWQDNAPVRFLNWDYGQPLYGNPGSGNPQNCVYMWMASIHGGRWRDRSCGQQLGYVCQTKQDPQIQQKPTPPSFCKSGYQSFRGGCYKLSSGVQTWSGAVAACQTDGAQLTSILDPYEKAFVFTLTDGHTSYWIGLSDSKIPGLYGWADGWPVRYSNWGVGQPSYGQFGGCVFSDVNARWNDSDCSTARRYVCKISTAVVPPPTVPPGSCPDRSMFPDGGFCYIPFVNEGSSWPDANYQCEKRGMELVSIHSQAEMDFVFHLVSQAKSTNPDNMPHIWLGMTKAPNGAYQWSDHTAVNYLNWSPGEPSGSNKFTNHREECVLFWRRFEKWADVNCFGKNGYVCKTPQVPSTSTKRPVVMHSIFTFPTARPVVPVQTNPQPVQTNPQPVQTNPQPVQTQPAFQNPTTPSTTKQPFTLPVFTFNRLTQPPFNPIPTTLTTNTPAYNGRIEPSNPPVTKNYFTGPGNNQFQWANPARQSQTNTADSGSSTNGLSSGAIAGVVVAVIIIIAIAAFALVYAQRSGKLFNGSFSKMESEVSGFDNAVYDEKDNSNLDETSA